MRVKDIMTREMVTVSAETMRAEIAGLLPEHRIGGLPVLRDGTLVGIVTRAIIVRLPAGEKE